MEFRFGPYTYPRPKQSALTSLPLAAQIGSHWYSYDCLCLGRWCTDQSVLPTDIPSSPIRDDSTMMLFKECPGQTPRSHPACKNVPVRLAGIKMRRARLGGIYTLSAGRNYTLRKEPQTCVLTE